MCARICFREHPVLNSAMTYRSRPPIKVRVAHNAPFPDKKIGLGLMVGLCVVAISAAL